jgi:hypothetical protein
MPVNPRLLLLAILLSAGGDAVEIEFRITVDRGEDIGQSFGSLFEATTGDGTMVIGAGFQNAYNTRYRADRHAVHFFLRPTTISRELSATTLPRPSDSLTGAYLYSRDGVVYSTYGGTKAWDQESQSWRPTPNSDSGTQETMRVGNGTLEFGSSEVRHDKTTILASPEIGSYRCFFYANGHLCFYHVDPGDGPYRPWKNDEDGFSKLYACPWAPGDGAVDLEQAIMFRTPVVGETTFAWGQLGDQIVTGSNVGGFYVFENDAWRMILPPIVGKSFQLYSTVALRDRLLMGQYPSGHVFQYDGKELTELPDSPPVPHGVSDRAREAQTTVIYGGELFVGVWPWGELWRYRSDTRRWTFHGRLFDHPSLSDQITHPYDVENRNHTPRNLWGQRVTSLIPNGVNLIAATSAKSPFEWDAKAFPFLAPEKWKSYGMVYRLTMPGHLDVPTRWTDGPTTLEFTIDSEAIVITQDGERLVSKRLSGPEAKWLGSVKKLSEVTWGNGIYGRYGGVAIEGDFEVK